LYPYPPLEDMLNEFNPLLLINGIAEPLFIRDDERATFLSKNTKYMMIMHVMINVIDKITTPLLALFPF